MNKYIKLLKDEVIREEIITMYDIFYTGLEFGAEDIKYVLCLDDEAYVIPYIDNKPVVDEGIELTIISKNNSTSIEQIIENKIKELSE
jgi:hypothetical protein|nr:MAG TPA: hypothetical protein [Caudoviricetes sp.]